MQAQHLGVGVAKARSPGETPLSPPEIHSRRRQRESQYDLQARHISNLDSIAISICKM